MKTALLPFAAATLWLSGAGGQAQVTITEISRDQLERPSPEIHAFGGATLDLTLWLKGPPSTTSQMTARLFQTAGELAVPLGEPFPLGSVAFDHNGRQTAPGKISLPVVKTKTAMLVRFETETGRKPLLAGTLQLQVYPQEKPAALETLASEKSRRVAVFGESESLRLFLKNSGVNFRDLGKELPPELEAKVLYVGDASAKALADWTPRSDTNRGGLLVVFTQDSSLLPGVYETTNGNLTCTKVTLPILDRLNQDPLTQATFLNLLTQIQPTS